MVDPAVTESGVQLVPPLVEYSTVKDVEPGTRADPLPVTVFVTVKVPLFRVAGLVRPIATFVPSPMEKVAVVPRPEFR